MKCRNKMKCKEIYSFTTVQNWLQISGCHNQQMLLISEKQHYLDCCGNVNISLPLNQCRLNHATKECEAFVSYFNLLFFERRTKCFRTQQRQDHRCVQELLSEFTFQSFQNRKFESFYLLFLCFGLCCNLLTIQQELIFHQLAQQNSFESFKQTSQLLGPQLKLICLLVTHQLLTLIQCLLYQVGSCH